MRRSLTLYFVLVLLFVTYLATNAEFWLHWMTLLIFLTMLFIADLIFMGDGAFDFDPFYSSYVKKTDPKYFSQKIA